MQFDCFGAWQELHVNSKPVAQIELKCQEPKLYKLRVEQETDNFPATKVRDVVDQYEECDVVSWKIPPTSSRRKTNKHDGWKGETQDSGPDVEEV